MFKRLMKVALPFVLLGWLIVGFATPTFAMSGPSAGSVGSHSHSVAPFSSDNFFAPALSGTWNFFNDNNGVPSGWTQSHGSIATAGAIWNFPTTSSSTCQIWIYVPVSVSNATATIGYGIFTSSRRIAVININQNTSPGGWIQIWTGSGVTHVQLANNDGQTTTRIAVGTTATSLEVFCP